MSPPTQRSRSVPWVLAAKGILLCWTVTLPASETTYRVGLARVDITPGYPIRMAGYSSRNAESEGIEQRLWAKALAIESNGAGPALLISVENCVVPDSVTEAVAERISNKTRIPRSRFVLCATHTHTAPCLAGALPTMFGKPIPKEHQARIARYTAELTDHLERVALAALADRRPARLAWSQGSVGFARNRRAIKADGKVGLGVCPDGPVDHALPMLRVTDAAGKLIAVVLNYACHCTTLGGDFNRICGDWGGYAQEYVEGEHPGAACLITIGCGADADPQPRTGLDYAKQHGRAVAAEVGRLLKETSKRIDGPLTCRFERIRLPFDTIPTRGEWNDLVKRRGTVGYHAEVQLERLDRGEALQTELSYPVQTWTFGRDLAMVFLAGEVVVDYTLRLKREFDGSRLWVTAYANDVPCYIPSRRILAEGGYEAEGAMVYYDRPTRLSPEVEDLIVAAVHRLMPPQFGSGHKAPGSR